MTQIRNLFKNPEQQLFIIFISPHSPPDLLWQLFFVTSISKFDIFILFGKELERRSHPSSASIHFPFPVHLLLKLQIIQTVIVYSRKT